MNAKVAINTRQYFQLSSLAAIDAFVALVYFNKIFLDILTVILYNIFMRDATYFTKPIYEWQKRYEALRTSFVDRLPAEAVAERFGYSAGYVRLLRHQFTTGKFDFSEPVPEGGSSRYRVTAETRRKIRGWTEKELSAEKSSNCSPKRRWTSPSERWRGSLRKRDSPSFPAAPA